MTLCKKPPFEDYPNDLEISLDLPAPSYEEDFPVPSWNSFTQMTNSRAVTSPLTVVREGAPADTPPVMPEPRLIRDALETAGILLALCLGVGLPFLAYYVMGR